ncbi:triphosphoribosyl-dephospho-CoA synthase [Candidatus Hecatella orcuttiae]|uniref:triphosphoribosyl-dephospho-CoA synthase n=1 Tax=Candidatus Hecatella orcuttiae TaxID=1935119 RepID=UPI0028680A9A|nr:triphosphoribosyl-dephospho-CoA synthase [Candidatus Hecatella orcuttiae]
MPSRSWMKTAAEEIAQAAQLAVVLEVSAYPKPGNIDRFHDFRDTKYDHFLAGGIAIGACTREASLKGLRAGNGEISLSQLGIGSWIRKGVYQTAQWHQGGNTNLGTLSLLVPLAAGAGMTWASTSKLTAPLLRQNVKRALKATSVKDALNFYDAVRKAKPGGLKKPKVKGAPDVLKNSAAEEITQKRLTLYQVMKACAAWDRIGSEWATGMTITFKVGYPQLAEVFRREGDVNKAVVQCYLKILADYPDSLVARRRGLQTARRISEKAKAVLEKGGMLTEAGKQAVLKLHAQLRSPDNSLNPGTTADLTASSLMVFLLCGFRP